VHSKAPPRFNAVFVLKESLQCARQRPAQLLPGEHLASGSQFGSLDAPHDRVPSFHQIGTTGIQENAKRESEGVRGKHVPNELI